MLCRCRHPALPHNARTRDMKEWPRQLYVFLNGPKVR